MTFTDAVRSVLTQYATFSGRARRAEYWWFYLFSLLVGIVTTVIDGVIGVEVFGLISSLALLVPTIAVTVRRLHDTGRSAWWLLAMFLPILAGTVVVIVGITLSLESGQQASGTLVLGVLLGFVGLVVNIVLMCLPGTHGHNRYGPSPLDGPAGNAAVGPYGQQPYGQHPYGHPAPTQPFPQHPSAPPPDFPERGEGPRRTD